MASEAELGELKERARTGWDRANYALLAERLMPVAVMRGEQSNTSIRFGQELT